jgi:hypothetical protein
VMDDSRSEDKTSFGIGLILLIFAIGMLHIVMDDSRSEGRKPRSELAWLCLIFRIFCYLDAWGDGRGEDKTSFRVGLILRDFLLFDCYRSVLLSYHGASYSYCSPWILYWLSWYGMVVLLS